MIGVLGQAAACASDPPSGDHAVRSGSEIWGETCGNCHYNRSPSWYSDGQWGVAMAHMGIKANLTAEESAAVLRYLRAANGP